MIGHGPERESRIIDRRRGMAAMLTVLLASCAQPQPVSLVAEGRPTSDALYRADPVRPGRLAYAPDRATFAPMLTEAYTYPTQPQAEQAWQRASLNRMEVMARNDGPPGIRLFGCKPGALDSLTGRITRYRGPVVHCAADVAMASGLPPRRETVNFYYHGGAWSLLMTDAPRAPVAWLNREKSVRDPWRFLPWRDRYE